MGEPGRHYVKRSNQAQIDKYFMVSLIYGIFFFKVKFIEIVEWCLSEADN